MPYLTCVFCCVAAPATIYHQQLIITLESSGSVLEYQKSREPVTPLAILVLQ